ncbi:hypothetical protein GYMLUDRAFT_48632 [Collybiopsis luxurians FD-317 M1]|uniref:FAD-binding domain-containing protein n=1 Tax=Collybiopsis luxurians FD-317 M1 TaxID=944289 RepID=A0A0D0CHW1_9AGAR|nr:hypothetical protein GYMLUDRAFT_48632 [Collybiopsis luxurians FD-317 M1]
MPPSPEPRVLIIGAGVTGLLMAQSLRKLGIAFTVFERDVSLDARSRDWNFILHWARPALESCLPDDLTVDIIREKAATDDHIPTKDEYLPMFNLFTGEVMAKFPAPFSMRLQKQKLREVLSQGLDIKFGKRLANVVTDGFKVTATFEDGLEEEGQLLIGTDGAHSKVRDFLLNPERASVKYSQIVASRVLTTLPAEVARQLVALHPRNIVGYDPRGLSLWISTQDSRDADPSKWTFIIAQSYIPGSMTSERNELLQDELNYSVEEEIVRAMKLRALPFSGPFKIICDSIPLDAQASYNRVGAWVTEEWDNRNGTVTLAGDAAHPMTFHRGQGLNNAIQDVATLVSALKQHPPGQSGFRDALKIYEQEVWVRGREAVISSNENTEALMSTEHFTESVLFRRGLNKENV